MSGAWATAQQFTNLAFNGLFGIMLARFVSVSDFGLYNYVTGLASLGVAVMGGGLYGLAIREYYRRPAKAMEITASIIFLRELLALASYIALVALSLTSDSGRIVLATAIACSAILARVFDAPDLWFQSQLQAKVPALIRMIVAMTFFALRSIALFLVPEVYIFVILFAAEQIVVSGTIFVAFVRRRIAKFSLKRNPHETRVLARTALPLLLSSIANQVNLKIDMVILQAIKGSFSVGIYSAAVRLSELLYTLPVVFMTATFPRLLGAKDQKDNAEYQRQLQSAFDGTFWLGVAVIAGTYIFGDQIVVLLFGSEYMSAGPLLRIHVLACPFVFMAAVFSKWILAEGLLWLSLGRHIAGAIVAVILSLTLIPPMGATGAAIATVASYSIASYVFCFLTSQTLPIARQMTLAMVAPIRMASAYLRRSKEN